MYIPVRKIKIGLKTIISEIISFISSTRNKSLILACIFLAKERRTFDGASADTSFGYDLLSDLGINQGGEKSVRRDNSKSF